ncbi:YkvS family protein [Lentibacillus salinarum]|uniref:YkvS family protein n=1 Tax=Lentibacillus salinarum TaxID=446820 RepID=A0ABW3ZRL7_9BACI
MFVPDRKKAEPGDIIAFEQGGKMVKGKVLPSKTKNSIIVDISDMKDYETINYGYPNTVISHKKYRIVENTSADNENADRLRRVFG